jgi:hypothetical protein
VGSERHCDAEMLKCLQQHSEGICVWSVAFKLELARQRFCSPEVSKI